MKNDSFKKFMQEKTNKQIQAPEGELEAILHEIKQKNKLTNPFWLNFKYLAMTASAACFVFAFLTYKPTVNQYSDEQLAVFIDDSYAYLEETSEEEYYYSDFMN